MLELVDVSTKHVGLGAVLDVVMSALLDDLVLIMDEDVDTVLTMLLEDVVLKVVVDENVNDVVETDGEIDEVRNVLDVLDVVLFILLEKPVLTMVEDVDGEDVLWGDEVKELLLTMVEKDVDGENEEGSKDDEECDREKDVVGIVVTILLEETILTEMECEDEYDGNKEEVVLIVVVEDEYNDEVENVAEEADIVVNALLDKVVLIGMDEDKEVVNVLLDIVVLIGMNEDNEVVNVLLDTAVFVYVDEDNEVVNVLLDTIVLAYVDENNEVVNVLLDTIVLAYVDEDSEVVNVLLDTIVLIDVDEDSEALVDEPTKFKECIQDQLVTLKCLFVFLH